MTNRIITISGPSGSGKSTAANLLAKKLGFRVIDTGQIWRKLAKKYEMSVLEFGKYVENHPKIDQELDDQLMKTVKRSKKAILQGRVAGWMCEKYDIPAKKIWLTAKLSVRAKRIASREGISYHESLKKTALRDRDNCKRYKKIYGLDLNDLSVYDAVIDSSDLSVEEVLESLIKKLPKVWLTK